MPMSLFVEVVDFYVFSQDLALRSPQKHDFLPQKVVIICHLHETGSFADRHEE